MSRQAATEQPAPQLSGGRRGQGTETPPHTHLPVCTVCTTAETGSSLTRSESFPSLDSYLQRELEVRSYLQKELEVKSARVRARVCVCVCVCVCWGWRVLRGSFRRSESALLGLGTGPCEEPTHVPFGGSNIKKLLYS